MRRIGSAPELRPLSLVGSTSAGYAVTGACVAGIVIVTGLETWKPALASLGTLLFIPVLASAWTLRGQQALTVASLAAAARFVGYSAAGVDLGTAVAEVITLAALATMTRGAAVGLVEARERRARAARDMQALELLEQRERIGVNLANTAIRRLFALTLRLEALSARMDDPSLRPAVDEAIAEVDSLTTEFRTVVFRDAQPGSSPSSTVNVSVEPSRRTPTETVDAGKSPASATASDA
jgi:signal transduction histidine kinase